MNHSHDAKRFEELFRQHMSAAYNLARWLTGNESGAKDVVQESCVRAFRFLHQFKGGNARAWLLAIVRNQSYDWLKLTKGQKYVAIGDELPEDDRALGHEETAELHAIRAQDVGLLQKALAALPPAFRETIVLKELEEMAYKDIAAIMEIPLGTVMSRLARARAMLKTELMKLYGNE
jgi:RNA polymerase sigma-70 factor (ECF subfamily)